MKYLISLSASLALLASIVPAQAATVSSGSPVVFAFDISAYGEFDISSVRFSCPNCTGGQTFAQGAHFNLGVGSTYGGNDLFTRTILNNFQFDINNLSSSVASGSANGTVYPHPPALLDTVYVTFSHVDDVFDVLASSIRILGVTGELSGTLAEPPPASVPLPGALALLGGGIAGLGMVARRRTGRAAS